MKFPYTYKQTFTIDQLLKKLEIVKEVLDALPIFPHVEENLRRQSLLKSSLFSARIEGNRLRLDQVTNRVLIRNNHSQEEKEVVNILRALHWIRAKSSPRKLSLKSILKLHQIIMDGLSEDAGKLRKEPSAIFNAAGVAIYITPPPSEIKSRLLDFITYAHQSTIPGSIRASVAHFAFEKIHPFLDGNGRIGRLVSTFILNRTGYDFRGLVSFEEELEQKRQEYYDLLASASRDITPFVQFFLEILLNQAEKTIEQMKNIKQEMPEDTLLPRRREILEIIRDHEQVSFDFLHRRFLKVPKSSLHFDLKQLMKVNLIKKLGTTRGVVYATK